MKYKKWQDGEDYLERYFLWCNPITGRYRLTIVKFLTHVLAALLGHGLTTELALKNIAKIREEEENQDETD